MFQKIFILAFSLFSYHNTLSQENTLSKQVTTFTIASTQLKTTKKIWVYVPVDYHSSRKKFPVIYLNDAQNLFDATTSFSGEWNIDETLDNLKAGVIVVGIEHGNEKRIDELTPFQNAQYGGGKANDYLDFIVSQVKPHIEKNFRVKSSAKDTTIGGSSLGGLFSLYALQKYPDVFQKGIIFSPAFWINPEMYPLIEKSNLKAKIFFLCGDKESEDMVTDMQKMIAVLPEKCIITSEIIKDGQHNEKLWREAFAKAYLWLYK